MLSDWQKHRPPTGNVPTGTGVSSFLGGELKSPESQGAFVIHSVGSALMWSFTGLRSAPSIGTLVLGVTGSVFGVGEIPKELSWLPSGVWFAGSFLGYYLLLVRPWSLYHQALQELSKRDVAIAELRSEVPKLVPRFDDRYPYKGRRDASEWPEWFAVGIKNADDSTVDGVSVVAVNLEGWAAAFPSGKAIRLRAADASVQNKEPEPPNPLYPGDEHAFYICSVSILPVADLYPDADVGYEKGELAISVGSDRNGYGGTTLRVLPGQPITFTAQALVAGRSACGAQVTIEVVDEKLAVTVNGTRGAF